MRIPFQPARPSSDQLSPGFGWKRDDGRRQCQRLHCRAVPTARHDHVRLAALVVARPVPDACSFGAVLDRRLDVEVLEMHLLVRDDDVDVVDAAQAMIGDR
jgi:hypothetical protein